MSLIKGADDLRELSISYSLLNDELLNALCEAMPRHLGTLRIEAYPEMKPTTTTASETWINFANNFPDINLVL